jgi:hypothetical protein
MSSNISSQQLESYVPVYDTVPEKWEDARSFLVEHLKKISNAVNIRTIGWLLDEELLSGQAFIPGVAIPGNNPGQFRQILRIVVNVSPLVIGVNTFAHGVTFDANFTLIDLWVSGTNSTTLMAQTLSGNSVVMNTANLVITSPAAFDRAYAVIEYLQEK